MTLYVWFLKKTTEMRTERSCVFCMHVHVIFVTKYRKDVFSKALLQELKGLFHKEFSLDCRASKITLKSIRHLEKEWAV